MEKAALEKLNRNAAADGSQRPGNFIQAIIDEDLRSGKPGGKVVTRFPPEPNGYLHIGHAKSICLNFGLARDFGGQCHLRFDDTNPTTEDIEYVEAIQRDIRWLGFDWKPHLYHASDYFDTFYKVAEDFVERGLAYVDSLDEEAIREYRGTVTQAGKPSPYRDRKVSENLDLLRRMKAGEFAEGAHVLRAKIDLASPNMKMRDPLLYRIRHAPHYRTGDRWVIYPLYDFAHPLSDAIEGITHSICTLEFENNRELYDWVIEHANLPAEPHQYEFARLNLNFTVMSKRKLLQLVNEGHVSGWDDPRMLTVAGMRRRGYTPSALRDFCERIGVAKANSTVDMAQLEFSVRNDLNTKVPRVMAVLEPLKVVLNNFAEGEVEMLDGAFYPHDVPLEGSRKIPLTREIYIERSDFMENPPKGFFRLSPGGEVRLRHGYVIRCVDVVKHPVSGSIEAVHCELDLATLGKNPTDRKVKGTIHWVSASHGVPCEIRLYDRLFLDEKPGSDGQDFKKSLNPDSLKVLRGVVEPSIRDDEPGTSYQFERTGYFCSDRVDSKPDGLVFNRTVPLRDSWSKQTRRNENPPAKPAVKNVKKGEPQKPKVKAWREAELSKIEAYIGQWEIAREVAETLVTEPEVADYLEKVAPHANSKRDLANWVVNEWLPHLKTWRETPLVFTPEALASLVNMISADRISATTAKAVFDLLNQEGGDPEAIVEAKGWEKVSDDSALRQWVDKVLAENEDAVARFKAGNTKLMGFFVGQIMKATGGKADAKRLNQILRETLQGK